LDEKEQNMHSHVWGDFRHHGRGTRGGFFERGGMVLVILDLLGEQPRHGYDIIRELEERSAGFYSPSPGLVYPTLQSLEDRDFVTSSVEASGKKIYSMSDAGRAWLDAHGEQAARYRERLASCGRWAGGAEWAGLTRDMVTWFVGDVVKAIRSTREDPVKTREIRDVFMDAKKRIDEIVAR